MTLVVLTDDAGRQGLGWTEDGTGAARPMNHTYSLPHVHFSMATSNCRMLEHFPEPCWAEPLPPRRPLFTGEPEIRRDTVRPPDRPGLGVTLDRERLAELLRA
jgi:L-alanine-DL-glutamate epimerase-like enolase superfamily enzyme